MYHVDIMNRYIEMSVGTHRPAQADRGSVDSREKGCTVLELAVLGLLHEAPMHGYVLRKRLHETLGMFRTFSYGSLYPTLRRLQRAGLIAEEPEEVSPAEQAEPTATRASAGRSGSRQT